MTQLAPGWILRVEESTDHHWVATCRDLVLVFAYPGSHDDPRHIRTAARVAERLASELGAPAKMLFVVPPLHGKPPDATVRTAILESARRLETKLARIAVVVPGSGFGAAVHRSAVTSLLAVFRPKFPVSVQGNPRDGLVFLMGSTSDEALPPLIRVCEERMAGPAAPARAG